MSLGTTAIGGCVNWMVISGLAEGRANLMKVADEVEGLHNAANALAALALCRALNLACTSYS